MAQRRPIVGVITNEHMINDTYRVHGTGATNVEAVVQASGAAAIMIVGDPAVSDVDELREICDGFLLTGGRPNVHPDEYGHEPTEAHGAFDRNRDAVALELVRACVATGQPILGICRGFQEFNVAMGGTLHPEIRDLPGRMNHRMPPDGTLEEKFAKRHWVEFTPGGPFSQILGADRVLTNTLHGQGIEDPGPRVVIDGVAEDSTAEAIYIKDAPGFALAVQWHAEYEAAEDPVHAPLFKAFGDALRDWHRGVRPVARSA